MNNTTRTLLALATTAGLSQGAIVDGLTAYWNLDNNLSDAAHGLAGSASSVADDMAFVGAHPGNYGAGLFGGAGYTAAGPNTGHAEAPHSADVWGAGDNITVQWWGRANSLDVSWQAGVAKGEGNNWRFSLRP